VLLGGLTPADSSSDAVTVGGLTSAAQKATLPNAQHDAQATMLGGDVYVFGGGQFSEYDHILRFDPAGDTVTSAGTLPAAASDVAVAGDGATGYVVGGFDGVNWLNTVLAYKPGAAPKLLAHLPVGLRYAAAAVAGGSIVIAGGSTPSGISDAIYEVDASTGAVTTLGHLPKPLTHAGAGVIGSTVYVVGGRGALVTDRSAAIWAIDPVSGHVRAAGSLPAPTSDLAVVSLGGELVVAGGATSAGTEAGVGALTPAG
jgi:N-acetylneuraminic acid mutarotase